MSRRAARRQIAREVKEAEAQSLGPKKATYITLILVACFAVSAFYWAKNTYIDELTRGQGKVIPSSKTQIIQSLEGGIVEDLYVREGDIVAVDQPLLQLTNAAFGSDLGALRGRERDLRARIARLKAEIDGTDIVWPEGFETEHLQAVAAETALWNIRREQLETRIGILEQQVKQKRQEIVELENKVVQKRKSLGLVRNEIDITRPLVSRGLEARTSLIKLQREANDLEGEISAAELALPRAEAALQEATEKIEEAYVGFQTEARAELSEAEAELATLVKRLEGVSDKVDRTEIRSPVRGIVNTLHVNTIGGVVRPGMDIIEIVPLDDTLLVEARILPADVGFLRPGLEAKIKFTAYDFSVFGGLDGELVSISADSIEDEKSQESYYLAVFQTEKAKIVRDGVEYPLIPGMVTSVDIMTGKRSILQHIMDPLIKTQARALTER